MPIALKGLLIGAALAAILIIFEYVAITREVAERSKRVAKKIEWDSNQESRLRGMITFGVALTIGASIGAWWVWG